MESGLVSDSGPTDGTSLTESMDGLGGDITLSTPDFQFDLAGTLALSRVNCTQKNSHGTQHGWAIKGMAGNPVWQGHLFAALHRTL